MIRFNVNIYVGRPFSLPIGRSITIPAAGSVNIASA
jgi:hypothetical protein